jgi:ribonuclease HII
LGYQSIIGVDEVGRGALAGPVVVAAVEMSTAVHGTMDSKQIPKQIRIDISNQLHRSCRKIRFGQATNREIDELGMTVALSLAYQRALADINCDLVLTDHYSLPTSHRFIRATKGESLFLPVAAASIVAKVYRDQLMNVYHHFFPAYEWVSNVGYGTGRHLQAIAELGQTPLHRKTFNTKRR